MISSMTERGAIFVAILLTLAGRAVADEPPGKIRALIIDGQSNHDWRSTTRELRAALEKAGRFSVTVASAPERPVSGSGDEAMAAYRAAMEHFSPDLDRFDVLIDNYNGDAWSEVFRRSFVDHVRAGRLGLVIVHAANHPFADWPEFNRMMGLGWRDDPKAGAALKVGQDGKVTRVPAGEGPGATWDPKRPVTITVRDREHPITRGMPARWRHAADEVYHTLRGPAEGLHILASYQSDGAGGGTGEDEPAAWTVDFGRGRIFVTPLGHDSDGQRCPGFATLLNRATEWAATGRVTLALPGEFPTESRSRASNPSGLMLPPSAGRAQSQAAAPARKPPNIVFIFSDDHAYQAIGAYNDPRRLIETPHIDRLAREGMRFDRCLVPNSICGPSRASVLTGKYSHRNGFYNNTNSRFDGAQPTFPKMLRAAGYQTAVIGKWHLVTDPTGFDEWHILPGQGDYYNPVMIHKGTRGKHPGYVTDIITELSLQWLRDRDRSKPFLLMCQHKAPHREWLPALRHLDHDRDRTYPEPPTLFDNYSGRGLAEHDQDMTIARTMNAVDLKLTPPKTLTPEQRKEWDAYYEPRNAAFRAAKLEGRDLARWKYNRYLHDYLGCIKAVDESVGRLLEYLDNEGLAENTIVVYTSDQGFYLGEHGWFDKRWIFEESLRTPLLVRWPGVVKAGSVNRALVSNIDFAETFLDVAGLPVPGDLQGRSLVPLLAGRTPRDWRSSFYYEYYEYPQPHHVRPHHGVVTSRYKLVRFAGPDLESWELFDREKDPHELRSVYGDPAYAGVVADLKRDLGRLRSELEVPEEPPAEAFGRPRPQPGQ